MASTSSTFRLLSELREYPINSIALALMYLFQTAGHRRIVQELRQHLLWCFFSISKFSVDLNHHLYVGSSNLCRRITVIRPVSLFFFCFPSLLFFYTIYILKGPSVPFSTTRHCQYTIILFLYNKNQGTLGDFFDNSLWPSLSSFLSSFVLLIVLPCYSRSHSPWNIIAT